LWFFVAVSSGLNGKQEAMREQSRMVFLTGIRLKTMKNGKNIKKENRRKDAPLGEKDEDKRVAQTANTPNMPLVPLRFTNSICGRDRWPKYSAAKTEEKSRAQEEIRRAKTYNIRRFHNEL